MVRKKRTPEEMERRAKIRELLQVSNVSNGGHSESVQGNHCRVHGKQP